MRALVRRLCGLVLGATLFTMGAQQANAQNYVPAPPETGEVDGHGVHLPTGDLLAARGGVSIGPDDHHGLSFSQQYVDIGWRHREIPSISGSTSYPVASFMGSTTSFALQGGIYKPTYENGATLVFGGSQIDYTAPDGTKIVFKYYPSPQNNWTQEYFSPADSGLGYASQVTFTDGTIWTYNYLTGTYVYTPPMPPECLQDPLPWDLAAYCGALYAQTTTYYHRRIASVTSNTGYQIKFNYASDTIADPASSAWHQLANVRAINNAVEYCSPTASCSLTQPWPTVTFSGNNVVDAAGDTTTYTYGGTGGRLSAIRRPGASSDTVAFTYDGSLRVATASAAGVTSTYTYGTGTTSVATPGAASSSITFNTLGQSLTRTVAGQASTFTYCAVNDAVCRIGLLRTAQSPEGQVTTYSYTPRGLLGQTSTAAAPGSGLAAIVTSAAYVASCTNPVTCNLPTSTTDATGQVTNYTYDATHGGVTQVQLPAAASGQPRPTITVSYASYFAMAKNSAGTLVAFPTAVTLPTGSTRCRTAATCAATVNEQVTQVTYNNAAQPNLLPTSVTTRLGNNTLIATTALTYNNLGQVLTVDGPVSGTTDTVYSRYDAAGRPVGSISADPDGAGALPRIASRITYANGLVTAQESGTVTGTTDTAWAALTVDQRVEAQYDVYGRPVLQRQVAPGGGTTQYSVSQTSYDSAGRVQCTAQRMNAPLTTTTLPAACTPMTAGANGPDRISQNVYDANGRLTTVQSGVGTTLVQNTQSFGYRTAAGQNGQLAWAQDAEGSMTSYSYDSFGRRYRTYYPDPNPALNGLSSTTDYDQVSFDAYGRISSFRTRANESFAFAYDNLGRVTSVNVPTRAGLAATHTRDVFYGYDLLGNMEYARFDSASGEGVTNAFNALGQLTSSTTNMDAVSRAVSYGYDVAGRLSSQTWPDAQAFSYLYDPLSRLQYLRNPASNNLVTWAYNAQGRLTSRTADSSAPDSTYGYDAAGRLSSLLLDHGSNNAFDANYSWTFNPASQIASETRDNNAFAFNAHMTTNIDYVANGLNQYTSTNPGTGAVTYGYDANANLTSDGATTYGYDTENRLVTATSTSGTVTLRYDPLGRLYEVTDVNGNKRRLYYSGDALIAEYDGAGTMLNRYVHGLSAGDDPLVQFAGSSVALADSMFLATDPRGSVVLTARRDGSATTINSYDEYGVPGTGNSGRFQYTGQAWVPELGMYYYKARMYSPTLGRFMQTDPIGYGDGMNLYAYVGGDPVNGVDPTGLAECGVDGNSDGDLSDLGDSSVPCPSGPGGGGGGGGSPASNPRPPAPFTCVLNARQFGRDPENCIDGLQQEEPELPFCRDVRQAAENARQILPARVSNPRVWNDRVMLRFYQLTYEDNRRDSVVLGGVASVADYANRWNPVLATRGAVEVVARAGELMGTASYLHFDAYVDAIQDRLDQLDYIADSSCRAPGG